MLENNSVDRRRAEFEWIKTQDRVCVDDLVNFVAERYQLYDIRNRIRQDLYLFGCVGLITKVAEVKRKGGILYYYSATYGDYDALMPKRKSAKLEIRMEDIKRQQMAERLKTYTPYISKMFGYPA